MNDETRTPDAPEQGDPVEVDSKLTAEAIKAIQEKLGIDRDKTWKAFWTDAPIDYPDRVMIAGWAAAIAMKVFTMTEGKAPSDLFGPLFLREFLFGGLD